MCEARRQRRLVDGRMTDWIVVRNRLAMLGSRNKRLVGEGLSELSKRMGFRTVDGFAERVVYRQFFPRGLTALDDLDETTLGTRPSMSHVTAREEVIGLLNALHLPLSENGKRHAAIRFFPRKRESSDTLTNTACFVWGPHFRGDERKDS